MPQHVAGTSEKANKRKRKKRNKNLSEEGDQPLRKNDETDQEEVNHISSGNKDTSEVIKSKKWNHCLCKLSACVCGGWRVCWYGCLCVHLFVCVVGGGVHVPVHVYFHEE